MITRSLHRLFALLLVPGLIGNPVAVMSPVDADIVSGRHFRPSIFWQLPLRLFVSQAIPDPAVAAFRDLENRRVASSICHEAPSALPQIRQELPEPRFPNVVPSLAASEWEYVAAKGLLTHRKSLWKFQVGDKIPGYGEITGLGLIPNLGPRIMIRPADTFSAEGFLDARLTRLLTELAAQESEIMSAPGAPSPAPAPTPAPEALADEETGVAPQAGHAVDALEATEPAPSSRAVVQIAITEGQSAILQVVHPSAEHYRWYVHPRKGRPVLLPEEQGSSYKIPSVSLTQNLVVFQCLMSARDGTSTEEAFCVRVIPRDHVLRRAYTLESLRALRASIWQSPIYRLWYLLPPHTRRLLLGEHSEKTNILQISSFRQALVKELSQTLGRSLAPLLIAMEHAPGNDPPLLKVVHSAGYIDSPEALEQTLSSIRTTSSEGGLDAACLERLRRATDLPQIHEILQDTLTQMDDPGFPENATARREAIEGIWAILDSAERTPFAFGQSLLLLENDPLQGQEAISTALGLPQGHVLIQLCAMDRQLAAHRGGRKPNPLDSALLPSRMDQTPLALRSRPPSLPGPALSPPASPDRSGLLQPPPHAEGEALLEAFRNITSRLPQINIPVARRLYAVRNSLKPGDLLWLSRELSEKDQVTTEETKQWIFYLFYQRERPWTDLPERIRDHITQNLEQAYNAELLSLEDFELFLFTIWSPLSFAEAAQAPDFAVTAKWASATLRQRIFWIRAASRLVCANKQKDLATAAEVADLMGVNRSSLSIFLSSQECPLPPLAMGLASFKLDPKAVRVCAALAKDSPDDILFVADAARVIGEDPGKIKAWAFNSQQGEPSSAYLLHEFELLPDTQWAIALLGLDPVAEPSPFELRVLRTFIAQLLITTTSSLSHLREHHFRTPFPYRHHALSLKNFMERMRVMAPEDGPSTIEFVVKRYQLAGPGLDNSELTTPGPALMIADGNAAREFKDAKLAGDRDRMNTARYQGAAMEDAGYVMGMAQTILDRRRAPAEEGWFQRLLESHMGAFFDAHERTKEMLVNDDFVPITPLNWPRFKIDLENAFTRAFAALIEGLATKSAMTLSVEATRLLTRRVAAVFEAVNRENHAAGRAAAMISGRPMELGPQASRAMDFAKDAAAASAAFHAPNLGGIADGTLARLIDSIDQQLERRKRRTTRKTGQAG